MKNEKQRNTDVKDTTQEQEEKKKKRTIIKTVAFLTIVIIIILLLMMRCSSPNVDPVLKDKLNLTIDSDQEVGNNSTKDKDSIIEDLNKKVEDGMINISMNMNPIFETSTSKGSLSIVNEEINKYPQFIEIYRDDTNELIYKSGVILVGNKISEAELDVKLPKGEYECTAYFNAVNTETEELVGKAGAKIKITIKN